MRNAILAVPLVLVCGAARADDAATHPAYWGSPSVDGGKCCATLAQVRDNIDRIDHAIVALMAERGKYVAEAGRFKPDPAAVSAPARVDAIIAKVRADARSSRPRPDRRRANLSCDDRRLRGLRARGMDAKAGGAGEVTAVSAEFDQAECFLAVTRGPL